MPDQLSLRLDAAVPNPPATLRPMLDRPLPEPFDSPAHLFEPMWGGVRALAFIGPGATAGGGDVTFVREDGVPILPTPIDLAGLAARVAAHSAVLDGELVVVDPEGRLDADELARRLAGEPGRPLAYLAFDLLDLEGRPQLSLPLSKRRELLRKVLRPGDELVAVPAIVEEGRALFAAVAAQGLAGIRARQASSPYLPGTRSRMWRSIAVAPAKAGKGAARAVAGTASSATAAADAARVSEAPVLALIARLPLGLEDEPAPG
jgi:bifunctional non-homologous end joining protein LigD